MRNDFIRIVNVSPTAYNACFRENTENLKSRINENRAVFAGADFIVFPRSFISGNGNADLNRNADFQRISRESLNELTAFLTSALPSSTAILTTAAPCPNCGRPVTVHYIINKNQTERFHNCACSSVTAPIFRSKRITFSVHSVKSRDRFADLMQDPRVRQSDVVFISAGLPAQVGSSDAISDIIKSMSDVYKNVVSISDASSANTVTPYIYTSRCLICNNGIVSSKQYNDYAVADIDTEILTKTRSHLKKPIQYVDYTIPVIEKKPEFCDFPREPFTYKVTDPDSRFEEMLNLQSVSIAGRLRALSRINPAMQKLILGVSGGIDSTVALLASVRAADVLDLPRSNVIAVTLPCFGTSSQTFSNAVRLIKSVGATHLNIDLKPSVDLHFADINHDPTVRDIVYENAQARERTQVLLDLANKYNALELATGDLSEIALGFSTFGGDQTGQFAVNACYTKTTLRHLLDYEARITQSEDLRAVLLSILSTPISPELLPPDESGSVTQKTEEVLGPYILHEYFLYYFLKYGFSAEKLLYYANRAFPDEISAESHLKTFLRRFYTSQFKRASAPEGSELTSVNLYNWTMPSDFAPSELLF